MATLVWEREFVDCGLGARLVGLTVPNFSGRSRVYLSFSIKNDNSYMFFKHLLSELKKKLLPISSLLSFLGIRVNGYECILNFV